MLSIKLERIFIYSYYSIGLKNICITLGSLKRYTLFCNIDDLKCHYFYFLTLISIKIKLKNPVVLCGTYLVHQFIKPWHAL